MHNRSKLYQHLCHAFTAAKYFFFGLCVILLCMAGAWVAMECKAILRAVFGAPPAFLLVGVVLAGVVLVAAILFNTFWSTGHTSPANPELEAKPRLRSDRIAPRADCSHDNGRRSPKFLIFGYCPYRTTFATYDGYSIVSPTGFYLVTTGRESRFPIQAFGVPVDDLLGDLLPGRRLPYQRSLTDLPSDVLSDPDWPLTGMNGDVIAIPRDAVLWVKLGSWINSQLTIKLEKKTLYVYVSLLRRRKLRDFLTQHRWPIKGSREACSDNS